MAMGEAVKRPNVNYCGHRVKYKGPTGNTTDCACMRVKGHPGKHHAMAYEAALADQALLLGFLQGKKR